jgi:hypothetical protein
MFTTQQKAQIEAMLVDLVDNMDAPEGFASHDDFKREWLFIVSDTALTLAKGVPHA